MQHPAQRLENVTVDIELLRTLLDVARDTRVDGTLVTAMTEVLNDRLAEQWVLEQAERTAREGRR